MANVMDAKQKTVANALIVWTCQSSVGEDT